jgi:hypothetical protein
MRRPSRPRSPNGSRSATTSSRKETTFNERLWQSHRLQETSQHSSRPTQHETQLTPASTTT